MSSPPTVVRWSTADVPEPQRFEYYMNALWSALTPMQVASEAPRSFRSDMAVAELGLVSIVAQSGSAHRCFAETRDLARSAERTHHLIINTVSARTRHQRGRTHLAAGDAVLADTGFGFDIDIPSSYEVVNIKFSKEWLRQWMPSPTVLLGRRIPARSGWARALTAFASQLSPQFVVDSPLPATVIVDQIGALLALTANVMTGWAAPAKRRDTTLRDRVKDCIVQRCAEPTLTALDVAAAINIPTRSLHRNLASFHEAFGAALIKARSALATRMLEPPLLRRLTIAEIGQRTGFADPSHFARVLRARTGFSPLQMRHAAVHRTPGEMPEATAS
jgi:AraC-like DNA-binding protein